MIIIIRITIETISKNSTDLLILGIVCLNFGGAITHVISEMLASAIL
jgi:hypothetical protein